MWIKALLSENKSTWSFFAHDIITRTMPSAERHIDRNIKMNIFLQSFNAKTSKLPRDLQRIMKIARDTGVRTEGIAFSREILRDRPIWFHSEASPRIRLLTHSAASICLRDKHKVRRVGEAEEIAQFLDDPNHNHATGNQGCSCHICSAMRENLGCNKPHACIKHAKELIDTLPAKWDPRFMLPE